MSRVYLAAGPPSRWFVTLADGSVVDVWAHSVEGTTGPGDQRDYRFCNLMDVPPDLQDDFEVASAAPKDLARVIVVVARFPRCSVARIDMAE